MPKQSGLLKLILCACIVLYLALFQSLLFAESPVKEKDVLDRKDISCEYHVAIKQGKKWKCYPPNRTKKDYEITITNSLSSIIFYWAVPAYPYNNRQVVFVRTTYIQNQPISLYRNGLIPWFNYYWGDQIFEFTRKEAQENYKKFHSGTPPANPHEKRWKRLSKWHDTYLWDLNEKTYNFVSKITKKYDKHPPAAERLVRLRKNRGEMSWIRLNSHVPEDGEVFWVTMAYSGTLDQIPEVKIYAYRFRVKYKNQ